MSRWSRLLAGTRLVGEVSFLFDGALIWAVAGTLVAVATPSPVMLAAFAKPVRGFFHAAIGFGSGWWGGLPWSLAFALSARAYKPPPAVATLSHITWIAAAVFAGGSLLAIHLGLSFAGSLGVGVIAATLTARFALAGVARRGRA